MDAPRIQYAQTSDGVNIAYCVMGEGPLLVLAPQFIESFSQEHLVPVLKRHREGVARGRRMVRFDLRGTGLSQPGVEDMSVEAIVRDLGAVVDAAGLERFSLAGIQASGPLCIMYAARHPERVSRLILSNAYARVQDVFSRDMLVGFVQMSRANWQLAARTFADTGPRRVGTGEVGLQFAEMGTHSTNGETVARLIEQNIDVDVSGLLPQIKAPTLIDHPQDFETYPVSVAQSMASAIPNARLVLRRVTDDIDENYQRVTEVWNGFLDEDPETRARVSAPDAALAGAELPSGTAVIFFADIADSTGLTERLGDSAFRDKARELDGSLRRIIREHSGTPVEGKLLGDGVLATFASASQAIAAALRCSAEGSHAGLPLHIGIHAGDVIREENNVYGGAVYIAARIAGESGPGEVLVSETVRSLARTSAGVRFEDRGEQALKGVGEVVRVWAVVPAPGGRASA